MTAPIRIEKAREEETPRIDFDEIFADHVAARFSHLDAGGQKFDEISWRRPGSGFYAIYYSSWATVLCVTGDCESAIYRVTQNQRLDFWASCDLSYFAGKCVASPSGRGFRVWSEDEARKRVRDLITESTAVAHLFQINDGWKSLETQTEWHDWLQRHGQSVLGSEWWEYGNVGMGIDSSCLFHLEGLKRAIAQLKKQEAVA